LQQVGVLSTNKYTHNPGYFMFLPPTNIPITFATLCLPFYITFFAVAQFHIINCDKKAVESYKVGRVTIATIQIEIYRTLGVKLDHLTTYAFEFLFMNGHLQHFFLSLL
jgi:hypothetical protein